MGKLTIHTTKYSNPADQARKEARKRELKRNKKQRQIVKAAVLKREDPSQILTEMDNLDMMEYNVECRPMFSQMVLDSKRKHFQQKYDQILKFYERENSQYWAKIKIMKEDYEKRRRSRIECYKAIRRAQDVTVDEIPLPSLHMPLNPEQAALHVPQRASYGGSQIHAQEPHLISGRGDLPSAPGIHTPSSSAIPSHASTSFSLNVGTIKAYNTPDTGRISSAASRVPPAPMMQTSFLSGIPLRQTIQVPGPSLQDLPHIHPNVKISSSMSLSPPCIQSGVPSSMFPQSQFDHSGHHSKEFTATSQMYARPNNTDKKFSATIKGKSGKKILDADVTRFLPRTLRVLRDDKKRRRTDPKEAHPFESQQIDRKPTKDEAYLKFMQEIEELL